MDFSFKNPGGALESHLVHHLGEPFAVETERVSGGRIELAGFRDVPGGGIVTLTSVGLSGLARKRKYAATDGGGQEVVMVIDGAYLTENFLTFFASVAVKYAQQGRQLEWGELLGLGMEIPGSAGMSILLTIPAALFDEGFQFCMTPDGEIGLVLLVPLYGAEVGTVEDLGLKRFVDELERLQPELWDLRRPLINLEV